MGHPFGSEKDPPPDPPCEDSHRVTKVTIRMVDWLSSRFPPDVWRAHGRKFKSIFCVELKSSKLDEATREGKRPFTTFSQGEYRLVYTEADDEYTKRSMLLFTHDSNTLKVP